MPELVELACICVCDQMRATEALHSHEGVEQAGAEESWGSTQTLPSPVTRGL